MKSQKPGFWTELGEKFREASAKHGELTAILESDGWVVYGTPEGVAEYKRLAVIGARAAGFHGTEEQSAHYWFNAVNGLKLRREVE